MPSAAKQKGNAWERDCSKHLSKIFDANFMRVPTSGAFTGGANVWRMDEMTEDQKRMMDGDIMVPPCLSQWKFECKNYKDLDFHKFFTKSRQLDIWIKQAESGDLWFLVVKISRKCKFVLFSKKIHSKFKINNYTVYDKYIITDFDGFFEENAKTMEALNEEYIKDSKN